MDASHSMMAKMKGNLETNVVGSGNLEAMYAATFTLLSDVRALLIRVNDS